MYQHIILKHIEKPRDKLVQEDVDWMCESFGFRAGRDLDHISSKLIFSILRRIAANRRASSDMVANELHISPARVNYHVRNIIDSGFLFRDGHHIFLRAGSVKSAVEEMRKDANRIFDELSEIAEDIDGKLGFKNR